MKQFLNPFDRKVKTHAGIRHAMKTKCVTFWCNNTLTMFQGPGCNIYCNDCQLNLPEYGGYGKANKPYMQARLPHCECCNKVPADLPFIRRHKDTDPVLHHQMIRTVLTVDHKDGDQYNNYRRNLWTLCTTCHAAKTTLMGDAAQGKKVKPDVPITPEEADARIDKVEAILIENGFMTEPTKRITEEMAEYEVDTAQPL